MDSALNAIADDKLAHGETLQPATNAAAIAATARAVKDEFGATLPPGYADFLKTMNGLNHDGLFLYGATQSEAAPGPGGFWQGIVAANRGWRDAPGNERLLVLGETDMDLLTVDLDGNNPVLRDKVSGDENDRFVSVADAIAECLRRRL